MFMNASHGVEEFGNASVGVRYVYRVSVCLWMMADAKTFLENRFSRRCTNEIRTSRLAAR